MLSQCSVMNGVIHMVGSNIKIWPKKKLVLKAQEILVTPLHLTMQMIGNNIKLMILNPMELNLMELMELKK